MNAQDSEAYRTAIRISDTLVSKGNPPFSTTNDDWVDLIWEGNISGIRTAGLGENSTLPVLDERYIYFGTANKLNYIGKASDGWSPSERDAYDNLKRAFRTGYDFDIKIFYDDNFESGDPSATPFLHIGMDNYTNTNTTVASFTRVVTIHTRTGEYKRGNLQVNVWAE